MNELQRAFLVRLKICLLGILHLKKTMDSLVLLIQSLAAKSLKVG